jgi:predicted AAA+ superfamily ATPase
MVHEQLLKSYHNDFSKHPPQEIVKRMQLLWQSVPQQLSKENKRFVYSAVRGSARAKDFETSIQWLQDAGLIYKVTRIVAGEIPLAGFEEPENFKLYMLDIGLLGAMNNMSETTLIEGNQFFAQYKGALTEQFVLQELQCTEIKPIHYWAPETGIAEVDFVIQHENDIIPIEVKAERNLRAKSLAAFINRYHTVKAIRTSLATYQQGDTVTDLPLYAISVLKEVVSCPTN